MSTPPIARAELVRMASVARLGQYLPAEGGLPGTWWGTNLESLERFAHLVIEDFLKRSGQYLTNDVTREAAIAEAVAAEREACAQLMATMREKSRNHLFRSALTCAEGEIRAGDKP